MPRPLPIEYTIIAPFWADTDLSTGAGNVTYGRSNDSTTLGRIERDVIAVFPEISSFSPIYAYIITWDSVGYYSGREDLVSDNFT